MEEKEELMRPRNRFSADEHDGYPLEDIGRGPSVWADQSDQSDSASDNASLLGDDEERTKEGDENSAYEEVRAAVPNYDEDLPANTVRAWVIGLALAVLGASVNTLFSLRQPSIGLGSIVAQLLALALGRLWARFMPTRQFTTFGKPWTLNPGPFNIKEHAIIVVMANVSFGLAYATDIVLAQVKFYGQDFGMLFQILLTITTQSFGYGIAGLLRKFLVYPASMIWPNNLVAVTLMHAMHEKEEKPDPTVLGGSMSRFKWFGLIFLGSFLWYWIPGFFAQFLSVFAFVTWMAPQNAVINQLFGGTSGMSLIPITFDWTQVVGYIGDPLIPPWTAIANTMVGVVVFYMIGAGLLHFGGAWYAAYLPFSTPGVYDNAGLRYNVTRLVTPELTLDQAAYKAYSPLFMSTTFALSYGLSFATISSLIVFTWIHYRHQIMDGFRKSSAEEPDIHMKLMSKYREAPLWWYGAIFGVTFALSLFVIMAYPTEFSWWAFLIAATLSCVFTLPIGIVLAITNVQITLNVISEFIMGYMQPGKPLALMLFKTYGYVTAAQALSFVSDLKFGHYMKLPPRTMFTAQVVATTISSVVQVLVLNWALRTIPDICTPDQPQRFTCPGGQVFFSASVIWGLLGPGRIFSPGEVYSWLLWGFPLGATLPIVLYYLTKWKPHNKIFKVLMAPLIFGGGGAIPPATPLNYISWGAVGFLFQYVIRKRHFRWWKRLNYLTASGLDTGLAAATLVIFFAFTIRGVHAPTWWGNTISHSTLDAKGNAVLVTLKPGETFGPKSW